MGRSDHCLISHFSGVESCFSDFPFMLLGHPSVPRLCLMPSLSLQAPLLPGHVMFPTSPCWSEPWDTILPSGYFHLLILKEKAKKATLLSSAEAVYSSLSTVNVMQCCETDLSTKGHWGKYKDSIRYLAQKRSSASCMVWLYMLAKLLGWGPRTLAH